MKLRHRRHSRNAVPAQLRQLLPLRRVNIHKPIHVPDTKPLDAITGPLLPLRPQTVPPQPQQRSATHLSLNARIPVPNNLPDHAPLPPPIKGKSKKQERTHIVTHLPV